MMMTTRIFTVITALLIIGQQTTTGSTTSKPIGPEQLLDRKLLSRPPRTVYSPYNKLSQSYFPRLSNNVIPRGTMAGFGVFPPSIYPGIFPFTYPQTVSSNFPLTNGFPSVYRQTVYPQTGFNPTGFNPIGFNPSGFNPSGFNPTGFNPSGFNAAVSPSTFPQLNVIPRQFIPRQLEDKVFRTYPSNICQCPDRLTNVSEKNKLQNVNIYTNPK